MSPAAPAVERGLVLRGLVRWVQVSVERRFLRQEVEPKAAPDPMDHRAAGRAYMAYLADWELAVALVA
jgi:hypothetical protein